MVKRFKLNMFVVSSLSLGLVFSHTGFAHDCPTSEEEQYQKALKESLLDLGEEEALRMAQEQSLQEYKMQTSSMAFINEFHDTLKNYDALQSNLKMEGSTSFTVRMLLDLLDEGNMEKVYRHVNTLEVIRDPGSVEGMFVNLTFSGCRPNYGALAKELTYKGVDAFNMDIGAIMLLACDQQIPVLSRDKGKLPQLIDPKDESIAKIRHYKALKSAFESFITQYEKAFKKES